MFDFLKKKISGFIDGITKKEEEKGEPEAKPPQKDEELILEIPEPEEEPPVKEAKPARKAEKKEKEAAPKQEKKPKPGPREAPSREAKKETIPVPKKGPEPARAPVQVQKKPEPEKKAQEPKITPAQKPAPEPKSAPEPKPAPEAKSAHAPKPQPEATPAQKLQPAPETKPVSKQEPGSKPAPKPTPEPAQDAKPIIKTPPAPEPEPAIEQEAEPVVEAEPEPPKPKTSKPEAITTPVPSREEEQEKPKERIKLGLFDTVKSFVTREVEISEKDVKEMVESLELELLEADVDIGVAEGIKEELMGKLVGSKVAKAELHRFISGSIKETLIDILTNEKDFDIVSRVSAGEKPVKIMFIGINGAGKTTTIAKVAKLLMDNNRKVVFAAADTFRAAAIEQMAVHAGRLNVKMIAREYGSDPTSVAYDAVNYARAHGADAVLIDTAGRQDTNISLLNEMKKMKRVISPDICIYIGESIAGNAILEQVSAFNREVGVDAVILSKLDCDPKGGTMLSISKATGVPIIYVGVGQAYDALERFDPKAIVSRIVE